MSPRRSVARNADPACFCNDKRTTGASVFSDAVHAWRAGLELDPSLREAACNIGRGSLRLNRYRDAAEFLSRCLREVPLSKDPANIAHKKEERDELVKGLRRPLLQLLRLFRRRS